MVLGGRMGTQQGKPFYVCVHVEEKSPQKSVRKVQIHMEAA
jgi:hypothetical protein